MTGELGKKNVGRVVNILRNQKTQWGGGGKMCVKIEFMIWSALMSVLG